MIPATSWAVGLVLATATAATGSPCDEGQPYTSDRPARVAVVPWKGTDTTWEHPKLQRRVQDRLPDVELGFYDSTDLYQLGRIRPGGLPDQPVVVPDTAIDEVMTAVEQSASIPDEALAPADWAVRAEGLAELAESIWFVDRPELREPLFLLYAQVGRAAELAGLEGSPWQETIGGSEVAWFPYLAASLAHREPTLLAALTDDRVEAAVLPLKEQLDSGAIPMQQISFATADRIFAPVAFAQEFLLTVDGLEVVITNRDALLEVPPGRTDVALWRADGPAMAERFETAGLGDKIYFVRNQAQNTMGFDFLKQLMLDVTECQPRLDESTRSHLAAYQSLFPDNDVYVVVPERGSVARDKLYLWRWDRELGQLRR